MPARENSIERHRELVDRVHDAVFDSPGRTAPEVRSAAGGGSGVPSEWADYVEKVRDRSYELTDDDIRGLRAAGHSDDEIFELTVAAAYGAALRGLEVGLAVVREADR